MMTIKKTDSNYPVRFRDLADAPEIHVIGNLPSDEKKTVLITGARFCSAYGRYTARYYGQVLASRGFQVITDMSLGVGGISAKAALDADGDVFAVFGNGVDVCYPPENRDLYDRIKAQGGAISQFPNGTAPQHALLEKRRRLLVALADVVVIIEARRKSSSLNVADIANELNKPVYALPGRVTDRLSDGCNDLIKNGAFLTFSPEDIAM